MVLAAQIRDQARQNTIQVLPDARKEIGDSLFFDAVARGPLLPGRWSQQRERFLRYNVWYDDYNWMPRGAISGILKTVASTQWEIKGPENFSAVEDKEWRAWGKAAGFSMLGAEMGTQRSDLEYFQQVLRLADFGAGWTSFILQGVDYFRHDRGWIWEVIAPGDPSQPIPNDAPIMGIAHLDTLQCRPTGDPDYPILYFDKHGNRHLLQTDHVRQLVDMPDGDERKPGYGDCALSRSISIVQRERLSGRYVEARLDDKPSPGFTVMQGITAQERKRAFGEYRQEQGGDTIPEWGRVVFFHGMDKDTPVEITSVPFSVAPEKFDLKTYTEIDIHAFALAIGVDVQDLWELTTGNLGSEGQSKILHSKSQGKTIGTFFTDIERNVNDLLPEEYEFKFKRRDAEQSLQDAQTAEAWVSVVSTAGANLQTDEARELLANTVEQIKDAITDENGQIRRVNDLGVQPNESIADDLSVQPGGLATLGAPADDPRLASALTTLGAKADGADVAPGILSVGTQPTGLGTDRHRRGTDTDLRRKDLDDTIAAFEADFSDAMSAMMDGDIERRRFGIVARGQLSKYGRRAMIDGLVDGGVDTDALDEEDDGVFSTWLVEQSAYVTGLGAEIKDGAEFDAAARVKLWVNKSLVVAYELGRMQSDTNPMVVFEGDDGEESCDTCQRLKGQVHRYKTVNARNLNPQLPGFVGECGAWNCNHRWVRTNERAQGNF
jgi:hypothetical protein